jgi:hypothetical protein
MGNTLSYVRKRDFFGTKLCYTIPKYRVLQHFIQRFGLSHHVLPVMKLLSVNDIFVIIEILIPR